MRRRTRRHSRTLTLALAAAIALLCATTPALAGSGRTPESSGLRIMLTNDDGYAAPGISAMRAALIEAGHDVTVVAPKDQQSGKGGSMSTHFGEPLAIERTEPGIWWVEGTPSDSVRVGLQLIMKDAAPDLVVSGTNTGQNLSRMATSASGTISAALAAMWAGVPAIAVSTGMDFSEARDGFPSTVEAHPAVGAFTARLIERLRGAEDGQLLPPGTMLNVNVPVPYAGIAGVAFAPLGSGSGALPMGYSDPEGAVAAGKGGVVLGIGEGSGKPDPDSDLGRFNAGFITITVMDGDMTLRGTHDDGILERLQGLTPQR